MIIIDDPIKVPDQPVMIDVSPKWNGGLERSALEDVRALVEREKARRPRDGWRPRMFRPVSRFNGWQHWINARIFLGVAIHRCQPFNGWNSAGEFNWI